VSDKVSVTGADFVLKALSWSVATELDSFGVVLLGRANGFSTKMFHEEHLRRHRRCMVRKKAAALGLQLDAVGGGCICSATSHKPYESEPGDDAGQQQHDCAERL
jgi:hypothetical protein